MMQKLIDDHFILSIVVCTCYVFTLYMVDYTKLGSLKQFLSMAIFSHPA